jgi:hypothetical protein
LLRRALTGRYWTVGIFTERRVFITRLEVKVLDIVHAYIVRHERARVEVR